VQLHQILSTLNRPTRGALRSMIAEISQSLEGGGAEGLRRAIPPLGPVLRDTAIVAEAGRGTRPGDLRRLVGSASRVSAALASRHEALAASLPALDRTAAALAADDAALSASVRELDGTLARAPAALAALDRSLPPTERFVGRLRPALRIAPPVLDRSASLLRQLDLLSGSPTSPADFLRLVVRLRPVLPELPRLALLARGLFPFVGPLITCLQDNFVPTLNSRIDDGDLSTNQPVWLELLHGLVGFAGAAQSFDANGYYNRYLGSTGNDSFSTGSVPGVGTLVGGTSQPILGARPRWFGRSHEVQFRPDVSCAGQPRPDLRARTGLGSTP
jgi:hypothetical protein